MRVIAATRNAHKLTEFSRILAPMGYEVVSQEEVCPGIEVEEDGTTFLENARKKAVEIFRRTGLPTIADDSGLCVDALGGAPGVYSARYADDEGAGHDDKANNRKLLRELAGVPMERRTARFVSAIAFAMKDGEVVECEGFCEGHIAFAEQGDNGFGYDPLFLVEGGSFAAISGEEKDRISHRGNALRKLQALLRARAEPAEDRLIRQNIREGSLMLTSKQRAKLKSIAAATGTILQVGKGGVGDQLVKQVDDALAARELVKLHVLETAPEEPGELAQTLAEATGSEVVQIIGRRMVLYRRNPKKPVITLD